MARGFDGIRSPKASLASSIGRPAHTTEGDLDNTTLLIIIVLVIIVLGGGFYGRGRWFYLHGAGAEMRTN